MSEYSDNISVATSDTNKFLTVVESVSDTLRKIPIVGGIFSTFSDAMKQPVLQAREFDRIMGTETGNSLRATEAKIKSITEELKKIEHGGSAQFLGDLQSKVSGSLFKELFNTQNIEDPIERREAQRKAYVKERLNLEREIIALYKLEAQAQSVAYSKSAQTTELAKANIEYSDRNAENKAKLIELFGPEAQWNNTINNTLRKQNDISAEIQTKQVALIAAKYQQFRIETDNAQNISRIQVDGNAREIAAANLRTALQISELQGTTEQNRQRATAVILAQNAVELANQQYDYQVKQSELQTIVIDLQTRGQVRAANQAKIRADYEVKIAEALQHQNTELAKGLETQKQSALLAEQLREYRLGARGRSAERLKERRDARDARVIESRNKSHENDQYVHDEPGTGGLKTGGERVRIRANGLTTGGLGPKNLVIKTEPKDASKTDQFTTEVKRLLGEINASLGR